MKNVLSVPGEKLCCIAWRAVILLTLLNMGCLWGRLATVSVYDQVPSLANQTGSLITLAWYAYGGFSSDVDFYVYDSFILGHATCVGREDPALL